MQKSNNTLTARFCRVKNGKEIITPKLYTWHIPKRLRNLELKPGDKIQVAGKKKALRDTGTPRYCTAVVVDVFREDIEDTGKRYRSIAGKLTT